MAQWNEDPLKSIMDKRYEKKKQKVLAEEFRNSVLIEIGGYFERKNLRQEKVIRWMKKLNNHNQEICYLTVLVRLEEVEKIRKEHIQELWDKRKLERALRDATKSIKENKTSKQRRM